MDKRYRGQAYAYGTKPNGFLVEQASRLPKGRVLCLGEGEGRNAVWLIQRGYEVTAVDASAVGLEKAQSGTQVSRPAEFAAEADRPKAL